MSREIGTYRTDIVARSRNARLVFHPSAFRAILRKSTVYQRKLHVTGNKLEGAALVVYLTHEDKFNEGRVSEFTPPHYLTSFFVKVNRIRLNVRMGNKDPGWALVEWGAHPGGNRSVRVLRYKPLTRALIIVAAEFRVT